MLSLVQGHVLLWALEKALAEAKEYSYSGDAYIEGKIDALTYAIALITGKGGQR